MKLDISLKSPFFLFSLENDPSQNFEMVFESFDLGVSGNFQIEAF